MDEQELQLTPLESAVLSKMLDKTGAHFEVLRQQLACVMVVSRRLTGGGFFTNFVIPPDANVRRDLPNQAITGVGAEFEGLQHGSGFVLFVSDGAVSCLEGYSYDEPWADAGTKFTLIDIP
jgi:hypothetical protein